MMRVIYGENRAKAESEIKKILGEGYEVYEGENLEMGNLADIFYGTSLLEQGERKILLKDLAENAMLWAEIGKFTESQNEIVIWEQKIDKRSAAYKALKAAKVAFLECSNLAPDTRAVFGILDLALRDGKKAVREVEKIENEQDPYMFFGLLVTQMMKKYDASRGGGREKRMLKLLAETDMQMKNTTVEPWVLIKSLLLRLGEEKI